MKDLSDLDNVSHFYAITDITNILCNKTQNLDQNFFKTETAYFLSKMAATMNTYILSKSHGEIPINCYAIALATSGYGKGHSVHIIENEIMNEFESNFMENTIINSFELNAANLATKRSVTNNTNYEEELDKIKKDYKNSGAYAFTFDSATVPAVKQLRNKILYSGAGAINLQIDEIGSNLLGSSEVLTAFLELYDQGMIKQKITKSTNENIRVSELKGKTPTNALLFGTPTKLFDGSQTEDQFFSMLDTGYARRCLFAWGKFKKITNNKTPQEIYQDLVNPNNNSNIIKYRDKFALLADISNLNKKIRANDDVMINFINYKLICQKRSEEFAEHEIIQKAEMDHRYFKALKLAGAYAFIDNASEISVDEHYLPAIKLVEESGQAFSQIMKRDKNYVKLAKYIAGSSTEQTHSDLNENLPFYKSSSTARNEMMTMAQAWGIKNNIVIKKSYVDGIEFFSGETLKQSNLEELHISYSNDFAHNYQYKKIKLSQIKKLAKLTDIHWCNHAFIDGHRAEADTIKGFDLIVLDVDGGVSINLAHELLKDINHVIYTTKRHTDEVNRFRLIIPMNYFLEMDSQDYKEFINNIIEWLPFEVDTASNQRSKKWLSNPNAKIYEVLDSECLDILKFIPKTSKNDALKETMQSMESMDNLERWFAKEMVEGNRNNLFIRYGFALLNTSLSLQEINLRIFEFNNKLKNPLPVNEIRSTILRSVAMKYNERNNNV